MHLSHRGLLYARYNTNSVEEEIATEKQYWHQFRTRYWPLTGYLLILMISVWLIVPLIFHFFHIDVQAATDGLTLGFNTNIANRSTRWVSTWRLFLRNYGLAWFYVLVAFLPIPTYWLFATINALTVGIVLAGPHPLLLLVVGILPHGIFEIAAQLLSLCIAAQITHDMQQRVQLLWRNDASFSPVSAKPLIFDMVTLVPALYGIAAVIESFVTPVLLHALYS
ncbi:MAG TPA: hypothetical protein DCW31_01840 [Lactobacillus sp.]|nr:hypothetical protein [Lactobacillus sp.]